METAKKIFLQIPKVMLDVGAIGKNGVNTFDKYNFRSIDDVYNKLQPALQKNGVFFIPQVLDSKEEYVKSQAGKDQVRIKLRVKYTVYADDGSSIDAIVEGEAIDRGDKATNKALTAAFKYMLIQIFCIAIEGQEDADQESPEVEQPVSPAPVHPAAVQKSHIPKVTAIKSRPQQNVQPQPKDPNMVLVQALVTREEKDKAKSKNFRFDPMAKVWTKWITLEEFSQAQTGTLFDFDIQEVG